MAFPRLGGAGIALTVGQGLVFGASLTPPVNAGLTNAITLTAGMIWNIPAGTYLIIPGPYTSVQWLDPVQNQWRNFGASVAGLPKVIDSDGANFRLANLTGTVVGGLITNSGSGYTNGIGTAATGLTITPSAGNSVWVPVVGGAINSTITITSGGSNYSNNFPPVVIIDAPPAGGIQATASCTTSGGAINAVTVLNQGAGYTSAPKATVVNDPRDTTGGGAVLTVNATLVNSGGLTAMYPSNNGNAQTSANTFTFSPASTTAATAVMNFTVTGYSGTGGTNLGTQALLIAAPSAILATNNRAANVAGPIADIGLLQPRPAIVQPTMSGGAIAAAVIGTSAFIIDAGYGFEAVPTFNYALGASVGAAATTGTVTATVGGTTDTSFVQRI